MPETAMPNQHRAATPGPRWQSLAGWSLPALLAVINIVALVAHVKPLGVSWRSPGGTLLDFRDLIIVPGRWLWSGGNPYDPVTYLAAHPWAQEFDPYSPSWLLLSAAIGWLPEKLSAAIYLVGMTAVSFQFARLLARWVRPTPTWWLAPVVAAWFQVWFPARGLGSSFLVIFGIALVFSEVRHGARNRSWVIATGICLACLKPQFGLPFLLALAALRLWDALVRGICLALATALPATLACVIAAGGVLPFLESVIQDVRHAASPAAPTGLGIPDSIRVDLPGLATRLGAPDATFAVVVAALLFTLTLIVLFHYRPDMSHVAVLVPTIIYLLPVHLSYDILLMVLPAASLTHRWMMGRRGVDLAALVLAMVPVVHLHRISGLAGLTSLQADALDASCVALTWMFSFLSLLASPPPKGVFPKFGIPPHEDPAPSTGEATCHRLTGQAT